MGGWEGRKILEVEQLSIPVIGGQVELGKKVGSQNALWNVGHSEFECELLMPNLDCLFSGAVALDERPVCSSQAGAVGALKLLRVGGGNNRDNCSAINQPPLVFKFIVNVQ